jgi:hypothetical protein
MGLRGSIALFFGISKELGGLLDRILGDVGLAFDWIGTGDFNLAEVTIEGFNILGFGAGLELEKAEFTFGLVWRAGFE